MYFLNDVHHYINYTYSSWLIGGSSNWLVLGVEWKRWEIEMTKAPLVKHCK